MCMTLRERLLTTLRGGASDRIPWNIYAWLAPDTEAARTLHRKGLGFMATRRIFRPLYDGVTVTEERKSIGGQPHFYTRIETPVGVLTEEAVLEPNYGSRWIRKFFIAGLEDYAAAEYFFRHTRFEPDFAPWHQADAEMGDGGIVVGEIMPIPIMTLMVSWMGVERMVEGIYDHPERFEALIDALNQHYDRHIQLAAESPAEIVWFGDNVTGTVISPKLFARYCAPTYARAVPVLQSAGKIPIAHYDGSNRPLVHCLAQTDLPVIEAFTPPPMGDLSVAEAKAAWPDKVVWVNFPGSLFLEPAEVIHAYTLDLLCEGAGPGPGRAVTDPPLRGGLAERGWSGPGWAVTDPPLRGGLAEGAGLDPVEGACPEPVEGTTGGRLVIGCTEDFPLGEFEKTFTAIGRALVEYEGYEW